MRTSMAGQDLQGGGKAMTRHVLAAGLAALAQGWGARAEPAADIQIA